MMAGRGLLVHESISSILWQPVSTLQTLDRPYPEPSCLNLSHHSSSMLDGSERKFSILKGKCLSKPLCTKFEGIWVGKGPFPYRCACALSSDTPLQWLILHVQGHGGNVRPAFSSVWPALKGERSSYVCHILAGRLNTLKDYFMPSCYVKQHLHTLSLAHLVLCP